MTADELVQAGDAAYNKGDYPEATKLYRQLISEYSEETDPALREVISKRRFPLAMAAIQSGQFDEADTAISEGLEAEPPLATGQRLELLFWQGVSRIQSGLPADAIAPLLQFVDGVSTLKPSRDPQVNRTRARLPEAKHLIGVAKLLSGDAASAAEYFDTIARQQDPGRRAAVMRLHALLEAGNHDAAIKMVQDEFVSLDEVLQLVAFQTLTLRLGDQLLASGRVRDAIFCFQRVWGADRLLAHQRQRLDQVQSQFAAMQAIPSSDPFKKIQLSQDLAKLKREVESFTKIQNFDAAVRLRMARAYYLLERDIECALILQAVLDEMDPDKVVESGTRSLAQSWLAAGRWDRAEEAAVNFEATFPESSFLPEVIYIRALALQKAGKPEDAAREFSRLKSNFPDAELAPRAAFQEGFSLLLAENYEAGRKSLAGISKQKPLGDYSDDAGYWHAMAYSLGGDHAAAREEFLAFPKRYPESAYRGRAQYRAAYSAHQLQDFTHSIAELEDYLLGHPDGEHASEARLLLGEGLLATGELERGLSALADINPSDQRFYEEGVFKAAKAMRVNGQSKRRLEHLEEFIGNHPTSLRVPEAIFLAGQVDREAGDLRKAQTRYWDAILQLGNDPEMSSVEELFVGLERLSKDELPKYLDQVEELAHSSTGILQWRALWAKARALQRENPEAAAAVYDQVSYKLKPELVSPVLLADLARAALKTGKQQQAERLWLELLKWNPRAPQKGQALWELSMLEFAGGNSEQAEKYLQRFAEQVDRSPYTGKALLAYAGLLTAKGKSSEARSVLNRVLEGPTVGGQHKAEALCRIGEAYLAEGNPKRAIPYFQQLYVMHSRWEGWASRAYLLSGQAFEELGDNTSARNTYQELISLYPTSEEAEPAQHRLQSLAPSGPPAEPSAQES